MERRKGKYIYGRRIKANRNADSKSTTGRGKGERNNNMGAVVGRRKNIIREGKGVGIYRQNVKVN